MTCVFRLSVASFRDLGGLSFSILQTSNAVYHRRSFILELLAQNCSSYGILHLTRLDSSEDNPESVRILLIELRLQNEIQIPKFAPYLEIYDLFDDFLRLLRESGLRVELRVLVLIRLRLREGKFVVFRRTQLRRCFQLCKKRCVATLAVSACRSLSAFHRLQAAASSNCRSWW